jgi:hypothetical protein
VLIKLSIDFLFTSTYIASWSTVEVGIGITAASLACLRPLVQKFTPTLLPDHLSTPTRSNLIWANKITNRRKGDTFDRSADGQRHQNTVITTVTGAQAGLSSLDNVSQENILPGEDDRDMMTLKTWDHGISKSVQVTTFEERTASRSSSASIEDGKDYSDTKRVHERV